MSALSFCGSANKTGAVVWVIFVLACRFSSKVELLLCFLLCILIKAAVNWQRPGCFDMISGQNKRVNAV